MSEDRCPGAACRLIAAIHFGINLPLAKLLLPNSPADTDAESHYVNIDLGQLGLSAHMHRAALIF